VKDGIDAQAVKAHVAMVSDRYLAGTGVQRMAEHLRLLRRLEGAPLATELFHHPDLGSSDLVVVTRDVPGLFSLIAGTLAAQGINIISAQIHTRADGIAIDTFQVNDPTGEAVTSSAHWRRTMEALAAVISGSASVDELLEKRRRAGRAPAGVQGPPKITIDNRLSDTYTVIEVKCPDRVGLLYLITRTLSGLGLDIGSARIATEIDQAYDTFYVVDTRGIRLEHPDAMDRVREGLEQALVQPL
jgi:[protein-PII] uridylyltransferase